MSLTVVKILWVHYIIADGITKEICARGEMGNVYVLVYHLISVFKGPPS